MARRIKPKIQYKNGGKVTKPPVGSKIKEAQALVDKLQTIERNYKNEFRNPRGGYYTSATAEIKKAIRKNSQDLKEAKTRLKDLKGSGSGSIKKTPKAFIGSVISYFGGRKQRKMGEEQ